MSEYYQIGDTIRVPELYDGDGENMPVYRVCKRNDEVIIRRLGKKGCFVSHEGVEDSSFLVYYNEILSPIKKIPETCIP